jgi:glycosyltransferase involved in cell wall biosynthesis
VHAQPSATARPRRFCFILPHFHFEFSGGAETQCYYIARELLRRGWEVHYIRESDETESRCVEGIHLHAIPKQRKLFKWRNARPLRIAMENICADVWYTRANPSYLPLVVMHARGVGGRTLWAFSRDSQLTFDHKRVPGRRLHNVVARLDQWRFFRALQRVDGILLQTQDQRDLLARARKLRGEVIYNAHPLPEPSAAAGPRRDLVVWIGRLQDFKRPERFVDLARRLEGSGVSFQMVGDAETPERREALERVARRLPNLQMLGRLPPDQVHALLCEAKLLVNTSDYEGFSNTFIEAWTRGVPVLSMRVDPDQLITRGGLGYLETDPNAAAQRIRRLIDDPEEWQALSDRCVELSRARFNIVDAVDRLEAVLAT